TAVTFLHIIPITIGFMGMINISTHAFNALRKPLPGLMLSLMRLVLVYIPLALLGSHFLGYLGIFLATAVTNVLIGIAALIWCRHTIATERQKLITQESAI
ncbi:MAG: MATE family efflux transporter, partial [Gammaproteobacteria bacterium]|nr:MATE family efflux transporter [Gammaproteobacteria bacterium]